MSRAASSRPDNVAIDLVEIGNAPAWERRLRDIPHAFAHTHDHCHAMRLTTGYDTMLWCHDAGTSHTVCPVAERRWADAVDIVTPFGFSGFVGNTAGADVSLAWRTWCRERGYVCGYVALNPVLANVACMDPLEVVSGQTLFLLDLTQEESVLRARLHASLRHKHRTMAPTINSRDDPREPLARFFVDNFHACFAGRGAGSAYDLKPATVEALVQSPSVLLVGVRGVDGIESVTLFGHTPYCADALFNVCTPAGRPHAFTLLWAGAMLLKSDRVPWLNLGGGIEEHDGVATFKRRFGGAELPFRALKQVFDRTRYRQLCAQAGVDADMRSGYFPAYRGVGALARSAP